MSEELSNKEIFTADELAKINCIEANLPVIRREIGKTGKNVVLLAATKTVPVSVINYAIDKCGITDIGENRVQELIDKYELLHKNAVNLHFIGRLQTNKVKYIIDKVMLIHSVDSEKLAAEIDRQARKIGKIQDILIEINIGGELSKGGIPPEKASEFAEKLSEYPNIRLRGIMCIPPEVSGEEYRKYFDAAYKIFIDIYENKLHNIKEGILSMGMSDSYTEAIECGSTLVRLGRALFGERKYPEKQTHD